MFRAPYNMVCISLHPLSRNLYPTLMLIGVDVLTPVILLLVIVFFFVITSFPSLPRDIPRFLVPVQRLSTEVLLMWFQNHVGSATSSWSFTFHFLRLLYCIVIMLMSSIYS